MKNVIKGLSESKRAEIATLAEQIYHIGFADGQAASSTVENQAELFPLTPASEGIIHEGKLLRKVDREACAGDYVRPNQQKGHPSLHDGEIYGPVSSDGENLVVGRLDYNVYEKNHNRTMETIEVFEIVGNVGYIHHVSNDKPLTANQQRAELIQRAREFVEDLKRNGTFDGVEKDYYVNYRGRNSVVEFVVNKEKRTVVAIARNPRIKVINSKGIAKCMPGDVFNADIGKAIALARALEFDIPQEFMEAVQPDEVVVGMKIKLVDVIGKAYERIVKEFNGDEVKYLYGGFDYLKLVNSEATIIIDDTNANYGHSDEA